ncbi:HAMP domain-containing sensor histidine kinase [Kineosporia sp. R_H_3]|uniref:HAMP domain-containing sensor histidine kinase n=1 Tax=Kineosporia sp. R_H_3 TaxID=1961848 RepID=UPI000B4C1B94|nr:HAMP domain-containing sensor histidine kinase [Kineosporia sp. R_H_3]
MRRLGRPRSLLARLALRTAVTGFGFFLVAGGAVVVVAARTTVSQVEDQLQAVANALERLPVGVTTDATTFCETVTTQAPVALSGRRQVLVQLTAPDGTVCRADGAPDLTVAEPMPGRLRMITGSSLPAVRGEFGQPVLVLSRPLDNGWTARVGGDLTDFGVLAQRLWLTLLVIGLPGALLAVLAGYAVTRNGLRPVRALADAAETIARTQDLTVRVEVPDVPAEDEVGRLATAFTAMTSALADARSRQARLISDAGHELRTPLTSLRANLDLLVRSERTGRALPAAHREALLADVTGQLDELSGLVSELVVLSHDEPARPRAEVRLDEVVVTAVERARRRAGDRTVAADLVPCTLADADAVSLERAVVNLLDNAVKFSPPASTVSVRLEPGGPDAVRLTVDDEGPGIAAEHRTDVFERFWRADDARSLPGSGLGLAIVADAASAHGGTASVEEAPGGGTRAVVTLPLGPPARDR